MERVWHEETLDRVSALLSENGLPVDDLKDDKVELWCECSSGRVDGAIGIERYGQHALIRSLVIAPGGRGQGLGTRLLEKLEARSRDGDIRYLFLLTETAQHFFRRRGYVEFNRDNVPEDIRQTAQFSGLCAASATLMRKDLRAKRETDFGAMY
mgnify:CR=1 FL=1|tara:strand:+ start:6499 stop:6960 length:462 start_codon:yes stop_codon:yes gene_type:complete